MSLITLLLTLLLSLMVSMSKALIYDFLVLSLQWPPALCRPVPSQCTQNPAPPLFGVHGLWPSSYTGYGVESCTQFGVKFDRNVCTDPSIVNDLNAIWPNYLGKNINFWRNEWEKHGTCALEVFDQSQYFANVIDLYYRVDIDYLLSSVLEINPDFNEDFDLPTFKQEIAGQLNNAMPQISCSGGNGLPVEIKEIRICFDDVGDQLINCPMADSFSCGTSTVKWYI